jgi:hypothetical protein
MPRFRPVLSSQSEPHQYAEGSCGLEEIELRQYRDFGLGAFAMSERAQACRLRFGEDKISSFERHADLRLIREVAVCAIVLCPVVHRKEVIHRVSKRAILRASEFTQVAMDPQLRPAVQNGCAD